MPFLSTALASIWKKVRSKPNTTPPNTARKTPLPPFDYATRPLTPPTDHIRLLSLLPGPSSSDNETHPLQCYILTTPLASPPPFIALSYTWGPDPPNTAHSIQVLESASSLPSSYIPLTPFLSTALHHLRSHHYTITTTGEDKRMLIWIDQICINQSSHPEKDDQVPLMGTLYSRAAQVLVWLGPAANGSDDLMDAFREIGEEAEAWGLGSYLSTPGGLARFMGMGRYFSTPGESQGFLGVLGRMEPEEVERTASLWGMMDRARGRYTPLLIHGEFKAWLERKWFERVWTVQEFCMCEEAVFVCGERSVRAQVMRSGLRVLRLAVGTSTGDDGVKLLALRQLVLERWDELKDQTVERLFLMREERQRFAREEDGARGGELFEVLRALFAVGRYARGRKATMHRDRIYALLGLAVDTEKLGIRPDYSPSYTDIMALTEAARAMIERGGRVEVLCYSRFPKAPELQDLPSWVPDWRSNLEESYYTDLNPDLFSASGENGKVKAERPSQATSRILELHGYIVDTIQDLTSEPWVDNGEILLWDKFLKFFEEFENLWRKSLGKKDKVYSEEAGRDARWRVPTGDLHDTDDKGTHRATHALETEHYNWFRELDFFLETSRARDPKATMESVRQRAERERLGQLGYEYRASMYRMWGKRAFLTKKGYLGMGPDESKAGDVVVIFCGGRIPFVLRPVRRGRFRYLGEAYCHGVMDGEIVGKEQTKIFSLV